MQVFVENGINTTSLMGMTAKTAFFDKLTGNEISATKFSFYV